MVKIELTKEHEWNVLLALYETRFKREADVHEYPKDKNCIMLLKSINDTINYIHEQLDKKGE